MKYLIIDEREDYPSITRTHMNHQEILRNNPRIKKLETRLFN